MEQLKHWVKPCPFAKHGGGGGLCSGDHPKGDPQGPCLQPLRLCAAPVRLRFPDERQTPEHNRERSLDPGVAFSGYLAQEAPPSPQGSFYCENKRAGGFEPWKRAKFLLMDKGDPSCGRALAESSPGTGDFQDFGTRWERFQVLPSMCVCEQGCGRVRARMHTRGVMLLESTLQIFIQPKPHCFLPPDEVLLMKCN